MWWHLHRFLRPFYVQRCVACTDFVRVKSVLCDSCATDIVAWPRDFCTYCGSPKEYKHHCMGMSTATTMPVFISWIYEGAVAQSIVGAKQGRSIDRAVNLVPLAFQNHPPPDFFHDLNLVVPVPPNHSRLIHSGFDLVCEFAAFMARALSIPLVHRWVYRLNGSGQKKQGRLERIENAKQVYRLRPMHSSVPNTRVLLIDDVRTTGATTDTIARLLLDSGCSEVRIWALAGAASLPKLSSPILHQFGRRPWRPEV